MRAGASVARATPVGTRIFSDHFQGNELPRAPAFPTTGLLRPSPENLRRIRGRPTGERTARKPKQLCASLLDDASRLEKNARSGRRFVAFGQRARNSTYSLNASPVARSLVHFSIPASEKFHVKLPSKACESTVTSKYQPSNWRPFRTMQSRQSSRVRCTQAS